MPDIEYSQCPVDLFLKAPGMIYQDDAFIRVTHYATGVLICLPVPFGDDAETLPEKTIMRRHDHLSTAQVGV
ncbi:hypothetical protein D3C84_979550 [compost metagenome]